MGWTYQGRPIGGRTLPGYGDCDPPEPEPPEQVDPREDTQRPWLLDSGYEYDELNNEWDLIVSVKRRTCRRNHADGQFKVGDVYTETVCRTVCDEDGTTRHYRTKLLVKRATEEG